MSDLQSITSLERQKAELEALVSEANADGDVVGRLNFETRHRVVSKELEALRSKDDQVAEVALLFDGAPVDGTRTIDATFAAQALSYFQSIVTTLFASSLKGELAQRGKIKGSELAALNIRGVATGSFGFILEEKDARQSSAVKTTVRESLEEATLLFEELTQIEEDDFLIDIDEINPRVFNALGRFFSHLEKSEASLKANLPDRQMVFDRAGIERAYRRISETNVKIDTVEWVGTLVGLSPIKRTFDFKRDGADEIVSGKFSHQVSQDYLERIESQDGITLGERFRASIEIGTIRKPDGTISVSYTVTDLEEMRSD
ncbi:hypothetical protein [Parasedimentitalea huanghaiensis]|uniref:Uncharacterized protein n=1 Tax=Parasedimentitalea huanghaiensis TaxID=2682100 RepID=A0A6L6WB82_9RHOB|nr:hypothetical protein [Zongyanglinia huanghaiensis]MVO15083.1 hypothetical protein [Zongyanglinia huanghaiensis]